MGKSPAIHIPSGARTADARENVKSRDIYISLISRIFTNLQAEPTTSSASAGEKFWTSESLHCAASWIEAPVFYPWNEYRP
jgi:hypothetical protein